MSRTQGRLNLGGVNGMGATSSECLPHWNGERREVGGAGGVGGIKCYTRTEQNGTVPWFRRRTRQPYSYCRHVSTVLLHTTVSFTKPQQNETLTLTQITLTPNKPNPNNPNPTTVSFTTPQQNETQVAFGKGCFLGMPVLLASADLEIDGLPGWELSAPSSSFSSDADVQLKRQVSVLELFCQIFVTHCTPRVISFSLSLSLSLSRSHCLCSRFRIWQ